MDVTREKIAELLKLVGQRYPGWTGFSDERFVKDETGFKRAAAEKAQELLSKDELSSLVKEQNWDEFIGRIKKVASATNLLFLGVPMQGDMAIVHAPGLDKTSFCTAVFDLLHGPDASRDRLNRFAEYAKTNSLPNKWTFPTYFMFLLHPEQDIFVKPSVIPWLLDFLGADFSMTATPSPVVYAALVSYATRILTLLAPHGAKDMIDAQSIIWVAAEKGNVRYWKIAPGENAWQWDECLKEGFIAAGWDDMGDIAGVDKSEFESRRQKLSAERGKWDAGWSKTGVEQLWKFAHIKEGDRIVANHGLTKVLGFGTVTGQYHFVPNVRYGHRIPVRWDDVLPRRVDKRGWHRMLIELDRREFEEAVASPTSEGPGPTRRDVAKDGPLGPAYFTGRTFELLAGLHESPTKAYYNEHRADIATHVEQPLRRLFADLAAEMPEPIRQHMEMEKQITARILKNDYGKGGAYDYIWGAFYPKGGKRISDPQLFVVLHRDRLDFGFYIGEYGKDQRERFARNCRENRDALLSALKDRLSPLNTYGTAADPDESQDAYAPKGGGVGLAEWLRAPSEAGIRVGRFASATDVTARSAVDLRTLIADSFLQLYPFVLLSVSDDPMPLIRDYIEVEDDTEDGKQPLYTISDVARDTSIDAAQISSWVKAIDRKRQAILYGPPGTGKTFVAEKLSRHLVGGGGGFTALVQFHPAYAYEDFIQGIRPESRADGTLRYPLVPGRFLDFCSRARTAKGTCVLIIDEINRANLARVFGELMYLLEYRDEEIPLAGGGMFKIPPNVRIIGTMNTADRSIALVDHALRRRFAFLPLYPHYEVLERYHADTGFPVRRLIDVLKELNDRVGDRHYWVGVTFFLTKNLSEQIGDIWRMEIEPYLEEYFFEQPDRADVFRWEKIGDRILKG
jgi:5-methylcytosine-specific restriction protein B